MTHKPSSWTALDIYIFCKIKKNSAHNAKQMDFQVLVEGKFKSNLIDKHVKEKVKCSLHNL